MGITAPLSHLVPDGATVASMVVLIGIAVGVDYSLFYLKREREERPRAAARSTRSRSPPRRRATPSSCRVAP